MANIMIGFLILYAVAAVYIIVVKYIEIKNGTEPDPEMFEGKERYVFNRDVLVGIEYWDRKEEKYVIY